MTTATARPASIRLSARLNNALNAQAKALKISKETLARRAIANMLEDIEDLRDAEAVLAKGAKPIPLLRLKAELGLDD